jgi:hypothetical protein
MTSLTLPQSLHGLVLITVQPDQVGPAMFEIVDLVLVIGEAAEQTLGAFSRAVGESMPPVPAVNLQRGEVLAWRRRPPADPFWFRANPPQAARQRHGRKYAEGEMTPDRVFYFRGPHGKLNLRAQNLITFMQIADGIDDQTWLYHLQRHDYSRWFRDAVNDKELAAETETVERRPDISPQESRALIKEMIEARYTAPVYKV